MCFSFSKKALLATSAIVSVVFLGMVIEHQRRSNLLVGTWMQMEEGKTYDPLDGGTYETFNDDGTGAVTAINDGIKAVVPTTYTFSGLSRLSVTWDHFFCDKGVVPLTDSCLQGIQPINRTNVFAISFSADGNTMFYTPSKADAAPTKIYYQRVNHIYIPSIMNYYRRGR